MNEIERKIVELIDSVKPYLISDGGNIDFVEYKDGVVYVKMHGACANCGMLDITLKDGIEAMIMDEIPEVKGIVNVG